MVDFIKDGLLTLENKRVAVNCIDGDVVTGTVVGFTSKFDNDEGVASVELNADRFNNGCCAILENEIESIEVIE